MNRVGVRMKMLTWKWINVSRWLTKPNMIGGIIIRRMERRRAGARLGAVWFSSRHFGVGGKFEVWTIGGLLFGMLYFYLLREGDQYWGVVWFLLIFSEKPKYAREMHGIIHSLNGGKLTFSLCLQLSFILNFHISETKKAACLAFWSLGDDWRRDCFCLGRLWVHLIRTYHQDKPFLLNLMSSWISRDILWAPRSPHGISCPLPWSNDSALSELHTLINAMLVCKRGSFHPIRGGPVRQVRQKQKIFRQLDNGGDL